MGLLSLFHRYHAEQFERISSVQCLASKHPLSKKRVPVKIVRPPKSLEPLALVQSVPYNPPPTSWPYQKN